MNKTIENLEYSKLLFFDIETVRDKETLEGDDRLETWLWKNRTKDGGVVPDIDDALEMYQKNAALFAEWGKIVCISSGYIHGDEIVVTSFTGDEKDILTNFVNMVVKSNRKLVGHNVIAFDLPYIRKRFFINGLRNYLPEALGNDVYVKPWIMDESVFDTMVAWKGSGYLNTSLEELTNAFGLPSPKDDIRGSEVSDVYYSGGLDKIRKYCEGDVAAVANIVRVWKGDPPLSMVAKEFEDSEKDLSVLQKLYLYDNLSVEIQDELREKIKGKKLTGVDKKNLKTILKGVYHRTDFISGDMDSKDVLKLKNTYIEDFIQSL